MDDKNEMVELEEEEDEASPWRSIRFFVMIIVVLTLLGVLFFAVA